MNPPSFLFCWLLLLVASFHVSFAQADDLASGEYFVTQSWSQEQDYARRYLVRVPNLGGERLPVLIFLHGNGGSAEAAMRMFTGRYPVLTSKYVLVFPHGYRKSWNIVAERSQADDRQFVEDIVTTLAAHANVDPHNFSVMGNSNGAALVNQLAIESTLPYLRNYITIVSPLNRHQHDGQNFRAKGAHNRYEHVVRPQPGKRLLNVSGTDDRLVPYAGGPSPVIPAKEGKLAFLPAEESTFLWAKHLGATGSRREQPEREANLEIFPYLNGDVVHIKVVGGGHDAGRAVGEQRLLDFLEGTSASGPEKGLVAVGVQKQLFVDDHFIAEQQNVQRVLGQPRKVGVVMEPSVPTDFHPAQKFPQGLPKNGGYYEFGRRLSVLWNPHRERFQMLYRACGEAFTAYAESVDGREWTKPRVAQDGGSNLISHRGRSHGTFYEASFMLDPSVPWGHPEKYKAAFNPGNTRCAIGYSSDGIHWTSYNDGASVTGRAADTFNQILWDPIARRYMLLTRTDLGAKGGRLESRSTRVMVHDAGNNLALHPAAWRTLANINVDDPQRRVSINGVPLLQMESMNVWIYENIYFGLMHVLTAGELTGAEGAVRVADPHKRPDADVIDYYIGTSRDGVRYDKSWIHAKQPFLPRGPDGAFDKAMLQPSSEIITRGDEHLIYYTGQYNRHHSPDSVARKVGKIGLATLPLDRFVGFRAAGETGTIVSKPFQLEGDELQVNVDARAGEFRVELLDSGGMPIESLPIMEVTQVDELRLKASWDPQSLRALQGQTVQLRFRLRQATLYACKFDWSLAP